MVSVCGFEGTVSVDYEYNRHFLCNLYFLEEMTAEKNHEDHYFTCKENELQDGFYAMFRNPGFAGPDTGTVGTSEAVDL